MAQRMFLERYGYDIWLSEFCGCGNKGHIAHPISLSYEIFMFAFFRRNIPPQNDWRGRARTGVNFVSNWESLFPANHRGRGSDRISMLGIRSDSRNARHTWFYIFLGRVGKHYAAVDV